MGRVLATLIASASLFAACGATVEESSAPAFAPTVAPDPAVTPGRDVIATARAETTAYVLWFWGAH